MPLNNRTQIQLAVILDIIIQIKYSRIIARKEKSKITIASRMTTLQKLIVNKSRSLLVVLCTENRCLPNGILVFTDTRYKSKSSPYSGSLLSGHSAVSRHTH